jgi:hypothetical protein
MLRNRLDRVAFFIRAYNDADHFVPLIAEFVKKKENPLVIINTDLDIDHDYRFSYLIKLGKIEIIVDIDFEYVKFSKKKGFFHNLLRKFYLIRRNRKKLIGKIYRRFSFNCKKQIDFLNSKNVGICAFEWSTPYSRGELVEKYFFAAKGIGITTVALPHGCNIFINSDVTPGYRKPAQKGIIPDQSDRNLFDYYIFQNPIRRDGWIKMGQDPIKTQAWGSLRFYPKWAALNKAICPKFHFEGGLKSKKKIVFMQFQKDYNLKNEVIFDTLKKISHLDNILLAVKDATREGKEYYNRNKASNSLGKSLVGWYGNEVHSPALIEWADIVLVVGGSIGIEAILQNKILIYPLYFNTNSTLYEHFEAAYCPKTYNDLEKFLIDIISGKKIPKPKGQDKLIKEIVYAGLESFDVPQKYYQQFKSISLNYGKTFN